MAKEIPTSAAEPQTEPTFLKSVAEMATLAEEAIRKLRTEKHNDGFKFADLQPDLTYLFPKHVGSLEYLGRMEKVVGTYLENTAISGLGGGADLRNGNAINANTSHFPWTVADWMKSVYTPRKEEIDKRVEEAFLRISNHATQELRNLTFDICSGSQDSDRALAIAGKPALSLEELTGKMSELKTRFYEAELPHPEDLTRLYELCFNAEVKQRGWLDLEDAQLIEVLKKENALGLFQKYNPEREIKLPEEKKEKKGRTEIKVIDRIIELAGGKPDAGRGGANHFLGNLIVDISSADNGSKKTQDQWIQHYNALNDGQVMASMGDLYLYFKSLKERFEKGSSEEKAAVQAALINLRNDFDWSGKNNWLIAGTRPFYNGADENARIVQHYGCNNQDLIKEVNLRVPVYLGTPIGQVSSEDHGIKYLQAVLDTSDGADIIVPTLEFISDKRSSNIKVWTPPLITGSGYTTRAQLSERAAGFYCNQDYFHLDGGDDLYGTGCSRGVRWAVPR